MYLKVIYGGAKPGFNSTVIQVIAGVGIIRGAYRSDCSCIGLLQLCGNVSKKGESATEVPRVHMCIYITRREALLTLTAPLVVSQTGCGTALINALEAISIAADIGAPILEILDPPAAGFIALVPGVINLALDLLEGKTTLSTASQVAAQLQNLATTGNKLLPSLSGKSADTVAGIVAAIQVALSLWQRNYVNAGVKSADIELSPGRQITQADITNIVVSREFKAGRADSDNPYTAKLRKPNLVTRHKIDDIRKHLADIQRAVQKLYGKYWLYRSVR